MNKCEHQIAMEEMGLDNDSLFELSFCQLDYLSEKLLEFIDVNNSLNVSAFPLRQVRKMLNVWESIHVIYNSNRDQTPLYALSRVLVDCYAVINLIYVETKDVNEQEVRFLLYLLDGIKARSKTLTNRNSKFDSKYITKADFDKIEQQCSDALKNDAEAISCIESLLRKNPLYDSINKEIFKENNWKYKVISQNSKYSWMDLYKQFDTLEAAGVHQNFLSHFIHGLGISDMQFNEESDSEMEFVLGLGIILINKTRTLVKSYYSLIIKQNGIDFRDSEAVKVFLDICPESTINKIKSNMENPLQIIPSP